MNEPRRPPPVTVTDPARPGEPLDLLVTGPDQPPRRRVDARWGVAAAAALVMAAAAMVVVQVRAEQQAASVVELSVGEELSTGGAFDRANGRAVLELLLQVRNDGPRAVTLLRGGVGEYGLARAVRVAPGEKGLLLLERTVACGGLPVAPAPAADVLELSVRTADGAGPRRVGLPLPYPVGNEQALQACGFVPLGGGTDPPR